MVPFVIKRLLLAVPTLLVVTTGTFFLVQLVPGNVGAALLGGTATPEAIAELNAKLGVDRPVWDQYVSWLSGLTRGDLGESFVSGQSVATAIARAVPATLSVAVLVTIVSVLVGVPLGLLAARRGGRSDNAVYTVCSVLISIPPFWLAGVLVLLLAVQVRAFPATDYVPLLEDPGRWISHLVLPTLAIAAAVAAQIALHTRSAVLEVLGQEYIRTLVATGFPHRRIVLRHVLRNAAIPVTTLLGLNFVFTLGGIVVIEAVFNLSGLGNLMRTAVQSHDLAVVQGTVITFCLLVVAVNLAIDVITAWLDPRSRHA